MSQVLDPRSGKIAFLGRASKAVHLKAFHNPPEMLQVVRPIIAIQNDIVQIYGSNTTNMSAAPLVVQVHRVVSQPGVP